MDTQLNYKTKQKSFILECIKETDGKHFTADDIAEMLNKKGNRVGMATVYRHLERLLSEGEIKKYTIYGKAGACYQYSGEAVCEHFHLKCTGCGKLIHADCTFLDKLSEHIAEDHGFLIDGTRTVFYGKCSECSKGNVKIIECKKQKCSCHKH